MKQTTGWLSITFSRLCRPARLIGGTGVDVGTWLHDLGLGQYEQAFRENDIDAGLLPTLTAEDLHELGVLSLGHRKRLLAAIAAIGGPGDPRPVETPPVSPSGTAISQAERRQLTLMFADLVGSTSLSSRLDPEDMREILRLYQDTVIGEITRAQGHVAKLMGDGVLAYFGWPFADEDDAERAVQAGLAVTEAVSRLSTPFGEQLAARVGIATGLVVVGDLGEGAAREEAVVGETPNLAARLQGAAPPGAVVIATGTRQLLGELFELRALEPVRLKGFSNPVSSFQVLGEHYAGSRFEARRPGGPLPMVGRDQELALVLERWRQAVDGDGQAVLLVGEAGIGKSRLIQATLGAVAGSGHTALRYQCSPHHTGTALWPVVRQLGFATGLESADDPITKLDKLEAVLRQGMTDISEAAALVAELLGIDAAARYPVPDLTPQQRRARTLAVLVEQLLGLARRTPVLVIFEDVHWIDPTTLELLGQALDRIAGVRVLMLLTARPDHQPNLGGHPHVTRLTLNRLGLGPTEAIVARLTEGRSLPPEVRREIANRTDGVPLFIEELTKAVLESWEVDHDAVKRRAAVPASLHASLMARLDRIAGVKEVAQVAACIGREFSYPLLAAVSSLPEGELQAALDRLVAAELVFSRGAPPEASYSFKHALVRDAAYESLLKAQRQQLHVRIVHTLEKRFSATIDAEPELIARHCTEAGLAEQAADYWQRAGEQAHARSAMTEAVVQLGKGLEVLEQLRQGPKRQRRELGLQLALGQASIAARGFAAMATGRAYTRAHELCRELGDRPELFPVLYGLSVFHFQRGELSAAHDVARELLRKAEEQGEMSAQVTGHRMMGSTLCQLGKFVESRRHFDAALALYDPVRDRSSAFIYAIDSRVMCLSWLSHVLLILGYPEQALARDAEVPAYVRELNHPGTAAVALSWGCIFRQLLRDRQSAREQAETVIALATEQGFPLYLAAGTVVRGWVLAHSERVEDGMAEITRGLTDYGATGAEMWSPYFLGLLAEVQGRAGQAEAGLSTAADALKLAERTGVRWIEAELHRNRGELLLLLSEPDELQAESCFRQAMDVAREQGAPMWELRAATSLAHLWRDRMRKTHEARDLLAPIYNYFTEGFDAPDLRQAKTFLDEMM
jgi:class 3 adenylate cyclase/predicted ATPase